jgi:hypothetical protein
MGRHELKKRLADYQWKSMLESIASTSNVKLKNCLAVADVSGSMGSMHASSSGNSPIWPCVALTLLLGDLSEDPWRGSFITFSEDPTFETIPDYASLSLSARATKLSSASWGYSTNFHKVFELILSRAIASKLAPDQMIARLFVFSDMQFDQASGSMYGETTFATIKRRFEQNGYPMPELVFWNLAGGPTSGQGAEEEDGDAMGSKPVTATQEGVSLMSGFSGTLMKFFLGQAEKEEDESLVQAMDKDWEKVDAVGNVTVMGRKAGDGGEGDDGNEPGSLKRKRDPLETLMLVLGAESFKGVAVVD